MKKQSLKFAHIVIDGLVKTAVQRIWICSNVTCPECWIRSGFWFQYSSFIRTKSILCIKNCYSRQTSCFNTEQFQQTGRLWRLLIKNYLLWCVRVKRFSGLQNFFKNEIWVFKKNTKFVSENFWKFIIV